KLLTGLKPPGLIFLQMWFPAHRLHSRYLTSGLDLEPPAPVTGPAFHMHDSDNQDEVGLVHIKDSVREYCRKVPANGWIERAKTSRLAADVEDQPLNVVVEPLAQLPVNVG